MSAQVPPEPPVRLRAVRKSFPTTSGDTSVLEGVDLTIAAGEKVSLVGASGSGKSTLLSLIAGLLRPDSGAIMLHGVAMQTLDDRSRAALRADRVGIVLQSNNLIPFLTAVENVELAMGFRTTRARTNRARDLLTQVGLDHRREHFPRHLSGGEAQRVAIAVALANEPSLLLADEVVGALDAATADRVVEQLFGADLAVLFVTHSRELAQRAERQLALQDRTVVAA